MPRATGSLENKLETLDLKRATFFVHFNNVFRVCTRVTKYEYRRSSKAGKDSWSSKNTLAKSTFFISFNDHEYNVFIKHLRAKI